jgi:hypothetical protein
MLALRTRNTHFAIAVWLTLSTVLDSSLSSFAITTIVLFLARPFAFSIRSLRELDTEPCRNHCQSTPPDGNGALASASLTSSQLSSSHKRSPCLLAPRSSTTSSQPSYPPSSPPSQPRQHAPTAPAHPTPTAPPSPPAAAPSPSSATRTSRRRTSTSRSHRHSVFAWTRVWGIRIVLARRTIRVCRSAR